MAKVYAVEETSGKRILVRIECDEPSCDAKIKPHPEISKSGWIKKGVSDGSFTTEYYYCPDCCIKHQH